MIKLPTLVQDLPLTRLTNSVLVGTMKFTRDQFYLKYPEGSTPPSRLADQLAAFQTAYDALNAAYALTRESLLTQDIAALDEEGDQLFMGIKETVQAAQRMTYVAARKEAADRLALFIKKYSVDVRENMISEWSKLQQMTEEGNASASLTADIASVGLTDLWARLTDVADELRDTLTQRSSELPAKQAMAQAREAIYPEYRALIQVLNAYAVIDSDTTTYASLISALNANIDYVRVHAMTNGGSTSSGSSDSDSSEDSESSDSSDSSDSSEDQGGGSSDGGSSESSESSDSGSTSGSGSSSDSGSSDSGSGSSGSGDDSDSGSTSGSGSSDSGSGSSDGGDIDYTD